MPVRRENEVLSLPLSGSPAAGLWRRLASPLLLIGLLGVCAPDRARAQEPGAPRPSPALESQTPAADEPAGTDEEDGKTDTDAEIERVAYAVEIQGDMEDFLRELLRRASQLVGLKDRPPASLTGLERRARGDLERLRTALRSEGFYDSEVSSRIDEQARPVKVTIEVQTGPAYRLARYEVVYRDHGGDAALPRDPKDIGIQPGTRARAPEIVAAQRELIRLLEERGYPFATVADRRAVIDRAEHTMTVTLTVDTGARVGFGTLAVTGLTDVEEAYVRAMRPWQEGETYDQRRVEAYRTALADTGLFDRVAITHAEAPSGDGNVPIALALTERPHRSVGGGAAYSSSEGFSGSVFWEHRNLFHRDEDLRLEARAGEIEQRVSALFSKPRFLRGDQTLLADIALQRRDTDAFEELSASSAVALERRLSDAWRGKLGLSAELTEITEDGDTREFFLIGLPGSAVRDTRDNILNPATGTRLALDLTPYVDALGDNVTFAVASITGSAYQALDRRSRVILAGRARLGAILGANRADIPASKRFYAGGGGSIRGYEFQKVGPLDAGGDPTGGLSLVEVSAELRLRVTDTIGIVPFVDGGTVFAGRDFTGGDDTELRWAAGLGVRYFTPIGPVRLDVAVPLNKRDGVDDDFQFYISIGQAF